MTYTRLMLTSVLALSLLGSAACTASEDSSSSAVEDPSQPSQPDPSAGGNQGGNTGGNTGGNAGGSKPEPQPVVGGDPASLDEALSGHKATERINFQVLAEDCGRNQDCLEDLKDLQDYIADCADCPPAMANFNRTVTKSQLNSGNLPTTLPQVKDVILAQEASSQAGGETGNAGGSEPGVDSAIDDVLAELNKMGSEETDLRSIVKLADPADQAAVEETVTDALSTLNDDETAKALLAGEKVPAADAATVIEDATSDR